MTPDSIYVTTACFYPDASPIWRLQESCSRLGIKLHPYGVGEKFQSWRHAKNRRLVEELEAIKKDYPYAMYVDGADTWFLAGLEWFCATFMGMAAQHYAKHGVIVDALISGETECYPHGHLHEHFPADRGPYRFPNAGQFFGKTKYLIKKLNEIDKAYSEQDDYNDQGYWLRGMADGRLDSVVIDTYGALFRTMGNSPSDGEPPDHAPLAVHFNGGGNKETRMRQAWEQRPWSPSA